jgi:hypothetical protein
MIAFIYLTAIYVWGITTSPVALDNIIYLTMVGYFFSWLYFLLVVQDFLMNGFGKWGLALPLASKYTSPNPDYDPPSKWCTRLPSAHSYRSP